MYSYALNCTAARILFEIFICVCTTPLGRPVLPDVNINTAVLIESTFSVSHSESLPLINDSTSAKFISLQYSVRLSIRYCVESTTGFSIVSQTLLSTFISFDFALKLVGAVIGAGIIPPRKHPHNA